MSAGRDHGVQGRAHELATGLARHLAQVVVRLLLERVGVDGREVQAAEALPVVAGLVADEHDGVRVRGCCLFQGGARGLDRTGGPELDLAGGLVLAREPVGVQDYRGDVLAELAGGAHVPRADLADVVAHGAGVIDHDGDGLARDGLHHRVDHGVTGERDDDLVARLERVEAVHLAPLVDQLLGAVVSTVGAIAVALGELLAPLVGELVQIGLVAGGDRLPGHLVLLGDGNQVLAGLHDVGDLVVLGVGRVDLDGAVTARPQDEGEHEGQDEDADDGADATLTGGQTAQTGADVLQELLHQILLFESIRGKGV